MRTSQLGLGQLPFLIFAVLIFLMADSVLAATYTQTTASGDWNDPIWNNGVPNGIDNGVISSGSGLITAGHTVAISGTSTDTTPNSLMVGWSGDGNLNITGGSLTVGNFNSEGFAVGESGNGVVTQSGTSSVTATALKFARLSGTGIYNLNGGTVTATSVVNGGGTAATLNLSGGMLTTSSITKPGGGAMTINFDGGTLRASASSGGWISNGITANVKNGGAVFDTQSFDVTVNSALLNDGTGGLTVNGTSTGVLRLNAANSYAGDTLLNEGFLVANVNGVLPATTLLTIDSAGTAARVELFATQQTIRGLASVAGPSIVDIYAGAGGGAILTIDTPLGQTHSYAGSTGTSFFGANFSIIKNGAGTQILSGNITHTGTTSVNAGILQIGSGETSLNDGASNFVLGGGKLVFDRNHDMTDFSRTVTGTGDVELLNQKNGYYRFTAGTNGALTNTGKVIVNLDPAPALAYQATLYLEKADRFSSNTELNVLSGSVKVRQHQTVHGITGSGGTVTGENGNWNVTLNTGGQNFDYSGTVSNSVGFIKNDAGKQTFSGTATYSGPTTVNAGSVQIGNGQTSTLLPGGDVVVAANASMIYDRNADMTDFTTQGFTGAGDLVLRGQSTGYFRMNAGYVDTMAHTGKTVIEYDLPTVMPTTQWFQRVLWLEKDNVHSSGAELELLSGKIYIRNSNTIGQTFRGIAGNSGTFITTDQGAVQKVTTDVPNAQTSDFAGVIGIDTSGGAPGNSNVALIKDGAGTQIFSGANTYAGTTTINAGLLQVDGTHTGAGSYTVNGGLLGGSGSITTAGGASVTLASGAGLSPGSSAGVLTFLLGAGSLDVSAAVGGANTGELQFELGASSDKVMLTSGTLNIGSGNLSFSDFAFTPLTGFGPGVYTLFDTSNTINGSLALAGLSGTIGGYLGTLSLADSNRDVILTVAVPEPGSLLLLACGLSAGFLWRRRSAPVSF